MTAIFERELKSYYNSITGYVFAAFVLLFAGIYMMVLNLQGGYPSFEYVLGNMAFVFIVAIPVLTMRVMAEERRQRTDQLLYSLPLSMTSVVMGKYLAMLVVIALPTLIMCLYPLILSAYGTTNLYSAYASIIMFFFLTVALAAIGMFISSLVENQAVAAGACFCVMLLLYFMYDLASFVSTSAGSSLMALVLVVLIAAVIVRLLTKNTTLAAVVGIVGVAALLALYMVSPQAFEGLFPSIMEKLSLFERFYVCLDGVFDLTSVVYYISVSGLFVFLSVQSLEKRRWS